LEQLFESPIVDVMSVKKLIGTAYPAANQLMKRLTELGVVTEFTGKKRNRRFAFKEYIDLFDSESVRSTERLS